MQRHSEALVGHQFLFLFPFLFAVHCLQSFAGGTKDLQVPFQSVQFAEGYEPLYAGTVG
jgi:hypothetical protein